MKAAFVTPRYGVEVVGGAEAGVRGLAERLVADRGWHAEVLTTTALDNRTWSNEYAPGTVEIAGVTVRRFTSERGRDPGFDEHSQLVRAKGTRASMADQERWVDLQGPVIRVTGYDVPYPYWQIEDAYMPSVERVVDAARRVLAA